VPRGSAREKVERDAKIVADRARGLTWKTIADLRGVTERQCRTVWTEHLREVSLEPVDVREHLREAIAQLDAAIEELALLAETTNNDPVRLGSIRARLDAMATRFEVMRIAGLVPTDYRGVRTETQLRQIVEMMLALFDKYEVPQAAKVELRAFLKAGLAGRNGASAHA
jgi:hypothetical protein